MAEAFQNWLRKQSGRTDDVGCLSRAVIDRVLDVDAINSHAVMSALSDARAEYRRDVEQAAAKPAARRASAPSCPGCRKPVNERGVVVLTRRSGVEDEGTAASWHRRCFESARTSRATGVRRSASR